LLVDGVDGPLARFVDYLTNVVAPSGVAPGGLRLRHAGAILLVSLYPFPDTENKTPEGCFVGFPAIWSALLLYGFVPDLPPAWSAALIALCAVLTFVPLYWLHPLRVWRLRRVAIGVMLAWGVAAAAAIAQVFPERCSNARSSFWRRCISPAVTDAQAEACTSVRRGHRPNFKEPQSGRTIACISSSIPPHGRA
jgi:hypothetical protein